MTVAIEESTYSNQIVSNVAIDDLSVATNLSNVAIAYAQPFRNVAIYDLSVATNLKRCCNNLSHL